MRRRAFIAITGTTLLGGLAGCGGAGEQEAGDQPTPTPRVVTKTVPVTITEKDTATPTPTSTPRTIRSPEPTDSPTATSTPYQTPTPKTSPSPTPTVAAEKTAAEHIDQAQTHLGNAVDALQTESGSMSSIGKTFDYDTRSIDVALENARQDLRRAEQWASQSQQQTIEYLKSYASVIETLSNSYSRIVTIWQEYKTADQYLRNDREDDSRRKLKSVRSRAKKGRSAIEDVDSEMDTLADNIEETGEVALAQLQAHIDDILAVFLGYQVLSEGYIDNLDGHPDRRDGTGHYNAQEWQQAEGQFQDAIDHYRDAKDHFLAGERTPNIALKSTIIRATCVADVYLRATKKYRNAARRQQEGHPNKAAKLVQKGNSILRETCD